MSKDWRIVLIVGVVGLALTLARRWNNKDSQAGVGVAGWTIFIIAVYLL